MYLLLSISSEGDPAAFRNLILKMQQHNTG